MSRRTPDWLIERLAQGELDAATAADVRARLAADGRDPDQVLAALAAADRETLQALPPARVAAAVRAAARPPRRWTWSVPALALAATAAICLAPRVRDDEDTRDKGTAATRLAVYRRTATHDAERLADGHRVARGDLLQLAYASPTDAYGVIVSIDGARHVTLHLPDDGGTTAARIPRGRDARLPRAFELDDAPGFERFFLVTAPEPFPVAIVQEAAAALAARGGGTGALPLPRRFTQVSLRLDKPRKESP